LANVANLPASTISTHVLDTELGTPAMGVPVTLYRLSDDGRPLRLTQALTDGDGRVRDLLERPLVVGDYRLEFNLAVQHGAPVSSGAADSTEISGGPETNRFFRRVSIDLRVTDPARSYHVPLLLAPFALTTYRGS
jgi:5-hydroxyisourate hydrolase